ncbi:MAG TPA: hypothetical protein VI298_08760 [Geobacteraceae bacterium]
MAQVTVNLPELKDWRTTIFGLVTSIGAALMQWFQTGHITWQRAVACALWAVFCYLVPDAKSNANMQGQIEALLDAVSKAPPTTAPVDTLNVPVNSAATQPVQAAIAETDAAL